MVEPAKQQLAQQQESREEPRKLTPPSPIHGDGYPLQQDRLVNAQEFANRLAIRRRTLGQRIREGSVPPPIRIRGRLYWRETIVAEFIRSMGK